MKLHAVGYALWFTRLTVNTIILNTWGRNSQYTYARKRIDSGDHRGLSWEQRCIGVERVKMRGPVKPSTNLSHIDLTCQVQQLQQLARSRQLDRMIVCKLTDATRGLSTLLLHPHICPLCALYFSMISIFKQECLVYWVPLYYMFYQSPAAIKDSSANYVNKSSAKTAQ